MTYQKKSDKIKSKFSKFFSFRIEIAASIIFLTGISTSFSITYKKNSFISIQKSVLYSHTNRNTVKDTIKVNKMNLTATSSALNQAIIKSLMNDSLNHCKGKVVDEDGIPLPGVTIIEEGKTNGTISDINGDFYISTSHKESLLIFDFIGYKQKKILANNDFIKEVILEKRNLALDEIVTIKYETKNSTNFKSENVKNNLTPSPLIGIKRFKRKIEHNLALPNNYKNKKVSVNIFINDSGKISDIKITTPVDKEFDLKLTEKIIEQGDWETAIINNKPTKSSRLVIFEF